MGDEMKQFISEFKNDVDYNKYFNNKEICFVDIETTGLSNNYNSIYLIGILYFNKTNRLWTLVQLFAQNLNEESSILEEFIKIIKGFDSIITYNGDTFDIPFINKRLEKFNLDYKLSKDLSFDMYRVVKDNRYYLNLENLKLKTLEKSIGIHRDDIYSGKECIQFYKEYVATNNEEYRDRVLAHNYDDLFYMINLLKILDIIDEKKSIVISYDDKKISLEITCIDIKGDIFIIKGLYKENMNIKLMHYDNNYTILLDEENNFEITMEYTTGLITAEKKAIFVDKNKLALSNNIIDSTNYDVALNIILLKIEKEFLIDNIKAVVSDLLVKSLGTNLY